MDQMETSKTAEKVILEQSQPKRKEPKVTRGPMGDRWLFVLNNYTEEQLDQLDQVMKENENVICGCYGLELAPTTGTAHVQGYIEFVKRVRPTPMKIFEFARKGIHWGDEKGAPCKKHCTREMNMRYCSKTREEDDEPNEVFRAWRCRMKTPVMLLREDWLYEWQRIMRDIFAKECVWNDRTIYWIYGPYCIGKTQFVKYLCAKYEGYILDGEKRHILAKAYKADAPLYIFPLAKGDAKVSYKAIEQVKDGCFAASFGTECNDMTIRNAPHVVIFGNEPPDYEDRNFHPDKYRVFEIREGEMIRQ